MITHIKSYLAYRKTILGLFLFFHLLYIVVFSLYRVNIEVIVYAFILSLFFGLIFICIDAKNYYKKITFLENFQQRVIYGTDCFLESKNDIDKQYFCLLSILSEYNKKLIVDYDKKYDESKIYYLMWTHQIKTPIQALKLLTRDCEIKLREELETEIFNIQQYVEMVINYNKIDDISNDLIIKEYDLDQIIKSVLRKYSKIFISKKIKLNYNDLNYKVLTDTKWFTIVLEQIISNAIKYTNTGFISIYLVNDKLIIKDSGIGIGLEDIKRVFESGYSGYNGRLDKKSTGIGLFISKIIMRKLSHEITIESEIGKGTSVILDISMYNKQ